MLNVALAQELAGLATAHGKNYCFPTQQTLLDRLRKFHGQTGSIRTLNRHLSALVASGWIERRVRHRKDKVSGWVFRSTLYVLLGPVWRSIKSMARSVAHVAQWRRKWTRMPKVANNVTPTGCKSSFGPLSGSKVDNKKDTIPIPEKKKEAATNFVAAAKEILRKK